MTTVNDVMDLAHSYATHFMTFTERKHHAALLAAVEAMVADIENLKAYAMHERSLGAEPFMMENHELKQELEAAKSEIERLTRTNDDALDHIQKMMQERDALQSELEAAKESAVWWGKAANDLAQSRLEQMNADRRQYLDLKDKLDALEKQEQKHD